MNRQCITCRHIRGPAKTLAGDVLVWSCHHVVDRDAEGKPTAMPVREARRHCAGDWWRPSIKGLLEMAAERIRRT